MTGIDVGGKRKVRAVGIHKVFLGKEPTKQLTSKHLCECILLNPALMAVWKCKNYAESTEQLRAWIVQQ